MNAFLTVMSGGENLAQSGKVRALFDLLEHEEGYYAGELFTPFNSTETFHLINGERNSSWVSLVDNYHLTKLVAIRGRICKDDTGDRGSVVMTWIRQSTSTMERLVVPVMIEDEEWYKAPKLTFKSKEQYETFLGINSETAGSVLNRLYTAYETDDKTELSSSLAMITSGKRKGDLILLKKDTRGAVLISLEEGEVIESEESDIELDELALAIYFKLHYGQRRVAVPVMRGSRVMRGPVGIDPALMCNGREWIPQLNQLVRVDGLTDVYIINDYLQNLDKFKLTIADPDLREADRIKSKSDKPRSFIVMPSRLRPMLMSY